MEGPDPQHQSGTGLLSGRAATGLTNRASRSSLLPFGRRLTWPLTRDKITGLWKCHLCSYITQYRGSLRSHYTVHSTARPYRCDQCEYEAKRSYDLKKHKIFKHSKKHPLAKKFKSISSKLRIPRPSSFIALGIPPVPAEDGDGEDDRDDDDEDDNDNDEEDNGIQEEHENEDHVCENMTYVKDIFDIQAIDMTKSFNLPSIKGEPLDTGYGDVVRKSNETCYDMINEKHNIKDNNHDQIIHNIIKSSEDKVTSDLHSDRSSGEPNDSATHKLQISTPKVRSEFPMSFPNTSSSILMVPQTLNQLSIPYRSSISAGDHTFSTFGGSIYNQVGQHSLPYHSQSSLCTLATGLGAPHSAPRVDLQVSTTTESSTQSSPLFQPATNDDSHNHILNLHISQSKSLHSPQHLESREPSVSDVQMKSQTFEPKKQLCTEDEAIKKHHYGSSTKSLAISQIDTPRQSMTLTDDSTDEGLHSTASCNSSVSKNIKDRSVCTKKAWHCEFCDILFMDSAVYFMHVGLHNPNDPWKCNLCDNAYHDVYSFTSHFINMHK